MGELIVVVDKGRAHFFLEKFCCNSSRVKLQVQIEEMRTLSMLAELPFEFSVRVHGGLEGHPVVPINNWVWVVFLNSKDIINVATIERDMGFKEGHNLQLPDTIV